MNKVANGKPIVESEKIVSLSAGANHSMAVSENGVCYSWGYGGKGLLGRGHSSLTQIALPIGSEFVKRYSLSVKIGVSGFITKYLTDIIKQNTGASQSKCKEHAHNSPYFMQQVCCSSNNTYAMTNKGEIFVIGDNTFCQHAVEDLNSIAPLIDLDEGNGIYSFSNISQIKIPQMSNLDKVVYI
jgi:alpha-tubulin suppressor-like RCC1 family protein